MYQNNAFGDQLEYNNVIIEEGSIICDKCHKLLLNKCEVKCTLCGRMKQRKNTYVCDQRKYRSSLKKIDKFHEILKDKETKHYICKSYHTDIQSQLQCVCCKLHFDTHLCKFNSTDYDFKTLLYQDVCKLQMMKIKIIFMYHVTKHYRRQAMRNLLFHIMSITNLSLVLQTL